MLLILWSTNWRKQVHLSLLCFLHTDICRLLFQNLESAGNKVLPRCPTRDSISPPSHGVFDSFEVWLWMCKFAEGPLSWSKEEIWLQLGWGYPREMEPSFEKTDLGSHNN